jgi:hypothetical protein
MSDPILLVVKRGALRRFDALQRQTSQLQVEVSWDRRAKARRVATTTSTPERRQGDRRQRDAYTWQAADFVVAVPESEKKG